jgi:hypothetical protein
MSELGYRADRVDRRYNDWHYPPNLPKDFTYMDLDGLEWCRRCWHTFLMVETSTNPDKPTIVLETLAKDFLVVKTSYLLVVPPVPELGGPAVFTHDTEITYKQLTPTKAKTVQGTLGDWSAILAEERDYHYAFECAKRAHYQRAATADRAVP